MLSLNFLFPSISLCSLLSASSLNIYFPSFTPLSSSSLKYSAISSSSSSSSLPLCSLLSSHYFSICPTFHTPVSPAASPLPTARPHFDQGDEDEDDTGEERLPSCFDYVMHFLTVFWKVLFACVPPTDYLNGWACFVVSIIIIGLLTAVIGDLASHFGCTIGLKDSVTAVVFVALGTSVPGEDRSLSVQSCLQRENLSSEVLHINVFLQQLMDYMLL